MKDNLNRLSRTYVDKFIRTGSCTVKTRAVNLEGLAQAIRRRHAKVNVYYDLLQHKIVLTK